MIRVVARVIALVVLSSFVVPAGAQPPARVKTIRGDTADQVVDAKLAELMVPEFLEREKRSNRVHLLFDELGNLVRPEIEMDYPVIDENDLLVIHQAVESKESAKFKVEVEGSLLVPVFRTIGIDASITRAAPRNKPAVAGSPWFISTVFGGPFAGEFSIKVYFAVHQTEGAPTAGSKTIKLAANPLYHFQATMGVHHSDLTDQSFQVRNVNGNNVIALNEGNRYALAISFIPYVWDSEGVDLFNLPPHGIRRLSPLVGLGMAQLAEDFYLGGAYQLSRGVFLTAGAHVIKTNELVPGQALGRPANPGELQTKEWQSEPFVGVSFPLSIFKTFLGQRQ